MIRKKVFNELKDIVGSNFVSNSQEELYIYSIDPGASKPREGDFVVLPKNVEEIQKVIRLANKNKIPIIPMGGGLTLSGLTLPVRGGIIVDLKRVDRILEINKNRRYALIEAGVTSGKLLSYLNTNYPNLECSIPDAPPSVTITGNVLIHGSGFLSQKYGNHGTMVNGIEVVLANGEICRLGSCALSDNWFCRGPIPDFIGLFLSSFGTLGIITKISYKLYPKRKNRDVIFGITGYFNAIPDLILKITRKDFVEDILIGKSDVPELMKDYATIMVYITADTEKELKSQEKEILKIYRKNKARKTTPPPRIKKVFSEKPQFASSAADFKKGGGFEYIGSFISIDKIPYAIEEASEISKKYDIVPTLGFRIIDKGHYIMFSATFPFNRADPKTIENARKALSETNDLVLKLDGIPWKGELDAQRKILKRIDKSYINFFKMIKSQLDPNGIMNPGNWEIK